MWTRLIVAMLLFLHGVVHLIGPIAYWRLAEVSGLPFRTTVLWDRVQVGPWGMQVLGGAYLLSAALFMTVAGGVLLDTTWWRALLFAAAALSLVITALDVKAAYLGAIVDVMILAMLLYR